MASTTIRSLSKAKQKKAEVDLFKLLENGKLLTSNQLQTARNQGEKSGMGFIKALVNSGAITERKLLEAIAELTRLPVNFELSGIDVDYDTVEFLSPEYLRNNALIPLALKNKHRQVITSEPLNFDLINMLQFCLEESVTPVLAERSTIRDALEGICQPYDDPAQELNTDNQGDWEALTALANEAPVVRYVQEIISQGIERQASDIHFESAPNLLGVRYRVNGRLTSEKTAIGLSPSAILSRLKVLADLNISERRQPQDGRIRFRHVGRKIDLRLSTLPTQHGENAVVRILDQSQLSLDWHELGFDTPAIKRIRDLIQRPNGLVLVTGPTGSGKTTTLYTALAELNRPDQKLFTVEDPIEYDLPGINQIQVNSNIGFTFATALRSILRQDPNIIMIGEIRDLDTAEIACRAALVGRLVFATLHTNSADQAVTRLKDLGVPEYLLEATLIGVMAQTLENVSCPECGSKGCQACKGSGSLKRKLRYEILEPYSK